MQRLIYVVDAYHWNPPALKSMMTINAGWEQQVTVALVKEDQIRLRRKTLNARRRTRRKRDKEHVCIRLSD